VSRRRLHRRVLLPFLSDLGYDVPPFDLSVEGVASMSVDPYKYGYTAKGVSALLYGDKGLRRHQYYAFDGWPGGIYVAPNVRGTRSAGPIAAAWAVMNFLGRDGYAQLVADAMGAAEEIADFVAAHGDLTVVSDPGMCLLATESTTEAVNPWTVERELSGEGWELERQPPPERAPLGDGTARARRRRVPGRSRGGRRDRQSRRHRRVRRAPVRPERNARRGRRGDRGARRHAQRRVRPRTPGRRSGAATRSSKRPQGLLDIVNN
jgi:hypothetical protein